MTDNTKNLSIELNWFLGNGQFELGKYTTDHQIVINEIKKYINYNFLI